MYFPYFHSFITFFILAISRSNFAQIQWSWTFFNSQDDELFKNVQDFRIWVKFDRVIAKNEVHTFFWNTLYFCYCGTALINGKSLFCFSHSFIWWFFFLLFFLGFFVLFVMYYLTWFTVLHVFTDESNTSRLLLGSAQIR